MILRQPPDPVKRFLARATALFDRRHADLVEPLFLGLLLARGRRTATAWFRASGITDDFRPAYSALWAAGRRASALTSRHSLSGDGKGRNGRVRWKVMPSTTS